MTELPKIISCGDGYIDRHAGEECDPMEDATILTSLLQDACQAEAFPEGVAQCDPATCTIVANPQTCAVCGNLRLEGEEE